MSNPVIELRLRTQTLQRSWNAYRAEPSFEHFVEFAITLNSLSEFLTGKNLAGLQRESQRLEHQALPLFGDEHSHPITADIQSDLDHKVHALCVDIEDFVSDQEQPQPERRLHPKVGEVELPLARELLLICGDARPWADLVVQLGYFGLTLRTLSWNDSIPEVRGVPMLLLDLGSLDLAAWNERIKNLRRLFPASQVIGLSVNPEFELLLASLRSGCDFCLPRSAALQTIVAQILDMNDSQEQEAFRVMVVEDSLTAGKTIERALHEQGVHTLIVNNPQKILSSLQDFNPDLILMDMYMPNCTGVEAARVIRQHNQYLSIPIVYLSAETDIALQVEALRLGGDHFLTKPFNPVFLNAIVKSKIERYRALRRSMYHDSLTGLLNHTSTKSALTQALQQAAKSGSGLAVIMLDIDHFKRVNDTYGHPVGDQIIRSLAWLLKQRVRKTDIVGRYGGEEFVVALANASADQALRVMETIRADFHEIRHPYRDTHFNISFSGGIAGYPGYNDAESLINAADAALYEAKRAGRNCLICAN